MVVQHFYPLHFHFCWLFDFKHGILKVHRSLQKCTRITERLGFSVGATSNINGRLVEKCRRAKVQKSLRQKEL